jgi:hypothetical protein
VSLPTTRALGGAVFSVGEEIAFEDYGQGGGGTLDSGIGLLHSRNRSIFVSARRDDVARGHLLEIDDVVRRQHTEGLLIAEVEGTLEALGHPAA